ncbi:MAG: hypothetical protein HUJ13_09030 [Hydrogenovibrio crunogenus]|nr:hypothetical protein [Hydrogenovibrio crunogenus]
MAEEAQILTIDSEEGIYNYLSDFLEGSINFEPGMELDFENLPPLRIRLTGDEFHGTITPSIMKVFIEFQKAIYKSYAQAKYNTDNINKLTKQEKQDLEIVIKVEEGSSIFDVDAQEILEKMAVNMATSLTGDQVMVITLGVGAMFFGASALKLYLNNRKEIRSQEITSETELRRLEQVSALSEQETRRMEILSQALQREPVMNHIHQYSSEVKNEMMKSFSTADQVEVDGVRLSGATASELVKHKRNESVVDRLDGVYRVLAVDSSDPLIFKVRVRDTGNHREFVCTVQDETLESRYKTLIQQAEWSRNPVRLNINAKLIAGDVKEAVIIGAEAYSE